MSVNIFPEVDMNDAGKNELGSLWDIVKLLADGVFHSGEELGGVLGVSRAAVWKHLQKLEGYGINLLSTKGRGYSIPGGLDLLSEDLIRKNLQLPCALQVQIFPQLDSTNSFLIRQSDSAMRACFAEYQSAGRGRRGRAWVSPMAQNIYCSVGWGFEGGVAALEGLSLGIGVAILRMLKGFGVAGASLKWPNDILYQDKKLAGILIEVTGDPAGYCQAVIGVGLNVAMQSQHTDAIDQPWISLNSIFEIEARARVSRNVLAASLLNELINVLRDYQVNGFVAYQKEWMDAAAFLGREVELRNGISVVSGVFSGVTGAGALLLATASGPQTYHGGEISLRIAP